MSYSLYMLWSLQINTSTYWYNNFVLFTDEAIKYNSNTFITPNSDKMLNLLKSIGCCQTHAIGDTG